MKTSLLWSLIITAAPSYSFAAQAVDCDELARHVTTKMERLYPVVTVEDGAVIITTIVREIAHDGPWMAKRSVESKGSCKRSWCSESDYLERPHPLDLDKLPASLKQLEKYEVALTRCIKAATPPCPYAKEIIFKIQTQKMLNSKCTDLFTQSVKEHKDRWTAERLAAEEAANKRKTFDDYIDASKR
ncbi:MAG TPA: hypothetical protein VJJ81_01010 [Candidatus Babeliales bacterium]|nr:hypothetical protein [Candidatus Babeliales bacterium]